MSLKPGDRALRFAPVLGRVHASRPDLVVGFSPRSSSSPEEKRRRKESSQAATPASRRTPTERSAPPPPAAAIILASSNPPPPLLPALRPPRVGRHRIGFPRARAAMEPESADDAALAGCKVSASLRIFLHASYFCDSIGTCSAVDARFYSARRRPQSGDGSVLILRPSSGDPLPS